MTYIRRAACCLPVRAARIMRHMHALVRASLVEPLIWETARTIVENVAPRDEVAQALAIREWIDARLRFVNDPVDVQLLLSPGYMLEHIRDRGHVLGNCADAAILAAALCEAIRIRCVFVSVAFRPGGAPFEHVFTIAYPRSSEGKRSAVEFDVTRPPGLERARFTRFLKVAA